MLDYYAKLSCKHNNKPIFYALSMSNNNNQLINAQGHIDKLEIIMT